MKKLFSKIAVVSVGAAMAIGLAIAARQNNAVAAHADEAVAYTLDGTVVPEEGNNSYNSSGDVIQDGITWSVGGNNTMSPWRIGGKNLTNVTRSVFSKNTLNFTATKVELTVGAASSITVNSLKLIVASDSSFETKIDEVSAAFTANSKMTFNPSDGKEWKDAYYKFDFNVSVSGTSNKYVQFTQADFYQSADGTVDSVEVKGPSDEVETLNLTEGFLGTTVLQLKSKVYTTGIADESLLWTSSDSTKVAVDQKGLIRVLGNSEEGVTITATSVADDTKSASILVKASLDELSNKEEALFDNYETKTVTDKDNLEVELTTGLTNFKVVVKKGNGSNDPGVFVTDPKSLRLYGDNILSIESKDDAHIIKSVELETLEGNPIALDKATMDEGKGTLKVFGLTGIIDSTALENTSVGFTVVRTINITKIVIKYAETTPSPKIQITANKTSLEKDEVANITVSLSNGATGNATITTEDTEIINLVDNGNNSATATALKAGTAVVKASLEGCAEVQLTLTVNEPEQVIELTFAQAWEKLTALNTPSGDRVTNFCVEGTATGTETKADASKYSVTGFVSKIDNWDESHGNGDFFITAEKNSTTNQLQVFRFADKDTFDQLTLNSEVKVEGLLGSYGTNKNFEVADPVVTITHREEPAEATKVNVAGAIEAINALEDNATAVGLYEVTGFVTCESFWSTKNWGALFIADDITAAKANQLEIYSFNSSQKELFDSVYPVGTQVKVTGSLVKFVKDGAVTPELTGFEVVKLADPSYDVEAVTVAGAIAKLDAIENPGANDNYVDYGKNFKVTGYVVKVDKFYTGEDEAKQFTKGNVYIADERGAALTSALKIHDVLDETLIDSCEVDAKVEVVGRLNKFGVSGATSFENEVSDYASLIVKEVAPDKITSIEVKTQPTKVEYTVGETFDSTGLVIKVNHSKAEAEELTEGFTLSAPDMTTDGEKPVTVTYEGQTAAFMITVNPLPVTLESITLAGPTKTEYNIGETLDTAGLVVTAHFSDESSEVVASGYTLSEVDLSTAGAKEVTVTYEGKTAKFNITVVDPIAVAKEAARTELNNYATAKGQANYSAKNWTELQGYLSQGLEALGAENCNTIEKINRVINATKSLVDGVKTAAQEAADALANAKTEAKDELTTYFNGKDATKYSQENNAKLADELTKGKAAIDAATSIDAVNTALTNAKAAMDAIPQIQPSSGGCGGSIAATSILLSTLALAGVGLLMLKRRKED